MFEIPIHDVVFHSNSYCDVGGRLFWWQGELYRGITHSYASFCREILENGTVQKLVDSHLLIDTELTSWQLPGYAMVLQHRRLPFVCYASEWCPEMLRDAALFVTNMMMELLKDDLTLVDVSVWDLLFEDHRPIYVDFCTLERADFDGDRAWIVFKNDFYCDFIYPLRLISEGYGNLVRWLMTCHENGAIRPELWMLLGHPNLYTDLQREAGWRPTLTWRNALAAIHPLTQRGFRTLRAALKPFGVDIQRRGSKLVQHLRSEVERIELPALAPQVGFVQTPSRNPSPNWTSKQCAVHRILSDLQPATVLDIGCHQGWYSLLAAFLGSRVVALDRDDRQVAHCYLAARQYSLPILPIVMDIRNPSPSQGICNQTISSALTRLPCMMVLALDLVHLLLFEQNLTFAQMSDTFAAFTKRWLLVEFVPLDNLGQFQYSPGNQVQYSLERFVVALRHNFHSITIFEETTDSVLLLCEI